MVDLHLKLFSHTVSQRCWLQSMVHRVSLFLAFVLEVQCCVPTTTFTWRPPERAQILDKNTQISIHQAWQMIGPLSRDQDLLNGLQ